MSWYAKQSATNALKKIASKRTIQKTAEAIGDLFGNKIADKIIKVPWTSSQNSFSYKWSKKYQTWYINTYRKIYIYWRKTENYWWSEFNKIV